MTGANSIGNNRINKIAVNKGLPKITAILALTVMATHITGIIGKNCAIAAPTATLAKIMVIFATPGVQMEQFEIHQNTRHN